MKKEMKWAGEERTLKSGDWTWRKNELWRKIWIGWMKIMEAKKNEKNNLLIIKKKMKIMSWWIKKWEWENGFDMPR